MTKIIQTIAEELRKWWSFDDHQRHTHSWHDRQSFIEVKLPELLRDVNQSDLVEPARLSPDIVERLRERWMEFSHASFDSADAGISANLLDEAIDEIERLRSSVKCDDAQAANQSAPALQAPHNSGERVPNGDTALAGADTVSGETVAELRATLDRADVHTAMLMERIAGFESTMAAVAEAHEHLKAGIFTLASGNNAVPIEFHRTAQVLHHALNDATPQAVEMPEAAQALANKYDWCPACHRGWSWQPVAQQEPAAWQWRYVGKDEPWATPSGGEKLTDEVLKREPPIEQRPLYATIPQGALPKKLTGEIACLLENCSPPDKQTPEAVASLIEHYQPTWDRIIASLSRPVRP